MRVHLLLSALALLPSLSPTAGDTLIVANKSEATVSLLDLGSGTVIATLPTGNAPHEVAVSPSGALALVANYGSREQPGSSLTLVEVERGRVAATIELAPYRRPHGVVFRSERLALVTVEADQALLEVDVETEAIVRVIPTGQEVSHMVAVTPDGRRAFVANIGSGTVTAIDLERGIKIADLATGEGAEGLDVSPDGASVWVTNRAADTVTRLDARSLQATATLSLPGFPIRAKVTPDGRRVLVTCARSGDLAVLDAASPEGAVRVALDVAGRDDQGRLMTGFGDSSVPIGVLIEPAGRRAFVAHANADTISVVDLGSLSVAGGLTAGREPDGMAYSVATVAPPAPNPFGARLVPRSAPTDDEPGGR